MARDQAEGGKRQAHGRLRPAEGGNAPEGPDRRIDGGREEIEEHHGAERHHAAILREHLERADGVGAGEREGAAVFGRQRLRQHEPAIGEVEDGQSRRHEEGHARAEVAEQAADGGADDEAEPEGRAHHAEDLGAVLRLGDVGEEGIGGGVGRTADAGEDAADEEPDHVGREARQQIVDREAEDREQQHRAAAHGVRQVADGGAEQELHAAIGEEQPAAPDRGAGEVGPAHLLDEARQHRHDQAEAHHVEEHGDEDEDDGEFAGPARHGFLQQGRAS